MEEEININVKTCLSSYMLSDKDRTIEVYQMTEKDFLLKIDGKKWRSYYGNFSEVLKRVRLAFIVSEGAAFNVLREHI